MKYVHPICTTLIGIVVFACLYMHFELMHQMNSVKKEVSELKIENDKLHYYIDHFPKSDTIVINIKK